KLEILCSIMFLLHFSDFLDNFHAHVCDYLVPPATAMGTTSVEAAATSKARPPARGKPSHISAVIKSTQRARVRSRLTMKARTTVEPVAVAGVCAVKVATAETPTANAAVIEITMMESVVTEVSAVRDVG